MYKSGQNLEGEIIDLREEMALISPKDTPFTTMLMGRGQVEKAKDITVTWREKKLNETRGTLRKEGSEAGAVILSERGMKQNVCQILEKVTSVSGTARALAVKGVGDQFLAEVQDRMVEMKRDNEFYFLNGVYTLEGAGETDIRQMNGAMNLLYSGNVVDLSATTGRKAGAVIGQLSENDILDSLQKMWDAGAITDYYSFLNASEKRIVNDILKNGSNVRLVSDQSVNEFGVVVQKYDSDFGTLNFVLNRWMPTGAVLNVDMAEVVIAELRGAFYEDLAKTGDYSKGHVLCENTIKLLNTRACSKIIGITK